MLKLSHVSKNFGGLSVLQDITFDVPAGTLFGLIGPNGAGKTTVFNLITGLVAPSSGVIDFNGQALQGRRSDHITRLGVARTFQNIRIFKEMSLLENVMVGMHSHLGYGALGWLLSTADFRHQESQARDQAQALLDSMGLGGKAQQVADNLSYGEQRKLELARALATKPKLLLLDEPVAGMNAHEKNELMLEILRIRERGYTIFLIEHDMRFVMQLCERIAVLNFGRIIAQGTPDEIQNNSEVIEAYLGRDDGSHDNGAASASLSSPAESRPRFSFLTAGGGV
jgi:branched-chain amino acid transport system ATP-binding protein